MLKFCLRIQLRDIMGRVLGSDSNQSRRSEYNAIEVSTRGCMHSLLLLKKSLTADHATYASYFFRNIVQMQITYTYAHSLI